MNAARIASEFWVHRRRRGIVLLPPAATKLRRILELAGSEALKRRASVTVERKPDGSRVTDADLAACDALHLAIQEHFPGDSVVSEEREAPNQRASRTWYIDPIDGTGSFVDGLAEWGPAACLTIDDEIVLGGFLEPATGDYWFAERGAGAWRNGEPLRPGAVATGDPHAVMFVPSQTHKVAPLPWSGRIRCLGSTAAHLAHVADGGGALCIVPRWKIWDIGCGLVLLEEAGRAVTDLSGRPFRWSPGADDPILAGDPGAIDSFLRALSSTGFSTPAR